MLGDDSQKNTSFCVSVLWNYDLLFIKHISRRCWDLIFSYMQVTLEFASCIIGSQGFLSSLRWIRCRGLPYSSSSIEVGLLGYAWTCPKATCMTFRKPGTVQVYTNHFWICFWFPNALYSESLRGKTSPKNATWIQVVHHFIPYSPWEDSYHLLYQSLNFPDSFPGISSMDHVSPLQVAQFLEDFGVTKVGGTRCGRYVHESFRE